MKLRRGFVSNSSSASFIIEIKGIEKCSHCGRSDMNIIDLIENSSHCEDEVHCQGKAEVLHQIKHDWGMNDPDIESLTALIEDVDDKNEVAYVELDYCSNLEITSMPNINILWSDH